MAISKEELLRRLDEVTEKTSAEDARNLFDDLSDYLNDTYDGPQPWDDNTGDVTPEYAAWEKKALEDLGLEESIFDTLNALQEAGNTTSSDDTPDDPDESSEKPHDEELAGEKTPEEDFMERAAAGEVPATSGVLAGDLTPEEIEMIQTMRAGKQPPKSKELAGETTPEEKEMLNITNRLAKNLSKHRW